MTDLIRETCPRSRGRVRCCVRDRRIAAGTIYLRQTYAGAGSTADFPTCPVCDTAETYVIEHHTDGWQEETFSVRELYQGWCVHHLRVCACDAVGNLVDCLSGDAPFNAPVDVRRYLDEVRADADDTAKADLDAPWDEAGWAAFTWRMRTSPAVFPEGVTA